MLTCSLACPSLHCPARLLLRREVELAVPSCCCAQERIRLCSPLRALLLTVRSRFLRTPCALISRLSPVCASCFPFSWLALTLRCVPCLAGGASLAALASISAPHGGNGGGGAAAMSTTVGVAVRRAWSCGQLLSSCLLLLASFAFVCCGVMGSVAAGSCTGHRCAERGGGSCGVCRRLRCRRADCRWCWSREAGVEASGGYTAELSESFPSTTSQNFDY